MGFDSMVSRIKTALALRMTQAAIAVGAVAALALVLPGASTAEAPLAPPSLEAAAAAPATCAAPEKALGVDRVVEIDTSTGPLYGDMTKRTREESFLNPREVVLTFDDGPVPWITGPILETLDKFCTKATFFTVGEMALNYPSVVKDVIARGHTVASHTWDHPLNIARLKLEKSKMQIEKGLAAVTMAAGVPVAPFFRFPGLSDSNVLLEHLKQRGIASFTVDVVSNDSYIGNPATLAQRVIRLAEARNGGILLFHDIKMATAKALPAILTELKARGFKVVHLKAKATTTPETTYDEELKAFLAKAAPKYVTAPPPSAGIPIQTADGKEPEVAYLAPPARDRGPLPQAEPTSPSNVTAGDGEHRPARQKRQKRRVSANEN